MLNVFGPGLGGFGSGVLPMITLMYVSCAQSDPLIVDEVRSLIFLNRLKGLGH